ncbi:MAG TPA: ABC transporter permease [Gammaproteobacteria bacterium]|jgi:ABC-type multidrug transport system permease subunit|nr:ABC transporter permease [Gammaproteobacteria bacterium]
MFKNFFAVFAARNREFFRDKAYWSWNVIFPVMLIVAFTLVFSEGERDLYKVAVYPALPASATGFLETDYVQFYAVDDLAQAKARVARHQTAMLIDFEAGHYFVNEQAGAGYILEKILQASDEHALTQQTLSGRELRYVDWVLPGILSMNMMFACLFGVGYVIVRYRKNGVLKRLKATPLTAFEFLTAQIASRLWLILGLTTVVFLGARLALDLTMNGSHLTLLLLFALGATSLISMGLIIASRTASEELADGLLNVLSWPMMLLSGVWFSMDSAHPVLQKLALLLPLTHITEGARAVMLDGASLLSIADHLLYLSVFTVVFLTFGSWLFRWDQG